MSQVYIDSLVRAVLLCRFPGSGNHHWSCRKVEPPVGIQHWEQFQWQHFCQVNSPGETTATNATVLVEGVLVIGGTIKHEPAITIVEHGSQNLAIWERNLPETRTRVSPPELPALKAGIDNDRCKKYIPTIPVKSRVIATS